MGSASGNHTFGFCNDSLNLLNSGKNPIKSDQVLFADNVFGKWPILDIDGNIVLCPTIAAARHLAVLYGKSLDLI